MKDLKTSICLVTSCLALICSQIVPSAAWPVTSQEPVHESSVSQGSTPMTAWHSLEEVSERQLLPESLHKRMMPGFPTPGTNRMLMARFHVFTVLTPIAAAAKALEDFYAEVAVKASTIWATQPQLSEFACQLGSFRINFKCIGDTIPWSFVKDMADRLWECACLQLTEVFDVFYKSPDNRIVVKVWLEIVTRSGSDSNDYREDSPPSITSP